jgi:MoaA/NifB/PqqE/SkfB family radical SAM enzyme
MSDLKHRSPEAKKKPSLIKALLKNPQIIRARPSLLLFLAHYMRKFKVQAAGENLILHSHLPPINSLAYRRFIDEHLLGKTEGPSHAQVGLTNACPQRCAYCYNRDRRGNPMDKTEILGVVAELKDMGVFWLGWTGGEPLLNKDIVEITERAAGRGECAVKLFTTGCTLTPQLASDLKNAGLFSVSVSLDHWREEDHDRNRGYEGAFRIGLKAIEIFKKVGGLHVGVSAVLSKEMIQTGQTEVFLGFLESLGIQEAWLSETKPSVSDFWTDALVISEEERLRLAALQDRYNRKPGMTVNYLGHFEAGQHFGCNAGHKMVYVDAFGEVSPCVFTPTSFGSVRETPVREIVRKMRALFPSEDKCFINANYKLLREFSRGRAMLLEEDSREMMKAVRFGPLAKFFELYYR